MWELTEAYRICPIPQTPFADFLLCLTTTSIEASGSCDVGLPCFRLVPGMGLLRGVPDRAGPSGSSWLPRHRTGCAGGEQPRLKPHRCSQFLPKCGRVLDKNISICVYLR